jgi:formate hydrogenlyase subunit 6/NADH:ubiquinone oxidoreductase subunit I
MARLTFKERLTIPTYDNEEYATTGRVAVDERKCNGCGMCVQICPGKALYLEGAAKKKKARMEEVFPQCMSCNDCAAICETGAITVILPYEFGFYFKKTARGDLAPPRSF